MICKFLVLGEVFFTASVIKYSFAFRERIFGNFMAEISFMRFKYQSSKHAFQVNVNVFTYSIIYGRHENFTFYTSTNRSPKQRKLCSINYRGKASHRCIFHK
jgi:hypothetical protein